LGEQVFTQKSDGEHYAAQRQDGNVQPLAQAVFAAQRVFVTAGAFVFVIVFMVMIVFMSMFMVMIMFVRVFLAAALSVHGSHQAGKLFQGTGQPVEHLVAVPVAYAVQHTVMQMPLKDALPHLVQGGLG
jgi:amino acid transporter